MAVLLDTYREESALVLLTTASAHAEHTKVKVMVSNTSYICPNLIEDRYHVAS